MCNLDNVKSAITPDTRLIRMESPTNPLLKIYDIPAICNIAKQSNIRVGVDTTFATSLNISPLVWGADFAVQSTTKYIG